MMGRSISLIRPLWLRTRQIVSVMRLRPFDGSTPEGRSKERYRRAVLTTLALATAQGIMTLSSFIWIPLVVGYLGSERSGLLLTIVSLTTILQFADLGIGNGLLNALSEANGRDD